MGIPKELTAKNLFWYRHIPHLQCLFEARDIQKLIPMSSCWRPSVRVDKKFLRSLHHKGGLHAHGLKESYLWLLQSNVVNMVGNDLSPRQPGDVVKV